MSLQWFVRKACIERSFLSCLSLSEGLAGFFPLHPMTITEAERQRAQTVLSEAATGTEDGLEERQKEAEV